MRSCVWLVCVCVALTGACGDGDDDDQATADSGVSGPDSGAVPDGGSAPTATAYAVGADFTSGAAIFSTVALPSLQVTQNALAGVTDADPVIRAFGDDLYIINRFGADNITIVNRPSMQLVDQISTGAGSNPQDVAVSGSKLYVCSFNTSSIQVLEGDANPLEIDISSYDPDGVPNCNSLYLVGDDLYVTMELLDDSFAPRGPGKVAVIDVTTDTVRTAFDLQHANPVGFLQPGFDGDLLVATVSFSDFTGCVERIAVGETPSSSCVIDNDELGGYASGIALDGDEAWLAITKSSFTEGELRSVTAAGALGAASVTPAAQQPSDVAVCPTGDLVVVDNAFGAAGVRVYDAAGNELTSAALDLGQPPVASGGVVCAD